MARQSVNTGTTANDGTGDTLRTAGGKINSNFQELYTLLGGDSASVGSTIQLTDSGVNFPGAHTLALYTPPPLYNHLQFTL